MRYSSAPRGLDGCDKMKQAIWKVAPFGDFRFRGNRLGQLVLGEGLVDFSLLEKALQDRFASKGWQRIEDFEYFVKSDATDFHSGHLKPQGTDPHGEEWQDRGRTSSRQARLRPWHSYSFPVLHHLTGRDPVLRPPTD